jgi:murein DD-endopeptidase
MPRGEGGRQAQVSDYDPALKNRPQGCAIRCLRPVVLPPLVPTPFRSPLLAFALVAIVFGCAAARLAGDAAAAVAWTTPTRHAPAKHSHALPTVGARAAAIALRAVGVPYRWGGASPAAGFDCSGLVYWAYGRLGIELPHSSYALHELGRSVARSKMRPGDLLFFSGLGHVGIYIGRGRMVHAPHSGSRVQVVRLGKSSYGGRLVGVRRMATP